MEINFSVPRLLGERRCLFCQIQNVFSVSVFDYKDDKTIGRVNRDADVEILLENDRFRGLVQTGVEIGMDLQGRENGLNQKRKIGELHSLFLCHLPFVVEPSLSIAAASIFLY